MSEAKPAGGPRTLVEEGTQLKGSLSSTCPIDVKGRVDGELTAPSLTVSASGAVHGKVKVQELLSEGELAGEVDADVVRLSGVVKDNTVLRAKSLEVKLAVAKGKVHVTFGECVLEVGDAPTREVEAGKREVEAGKREVEAGKREVEARKREVEVSKREAEPVRKEDPRAEVANGSIPPPKGTPSVPPPHVS